MAEPSIPTRLLVLGMLGGDGELDASELHEVASASGMTEPQVRFCLRRLVAEGVLEQRGRGRAASYRSPTGTDAALLPELELVSFAYLQDEGRSPWDGQWRLVGFNIPESRRAARDTFRDHLVFLGAALLAGGLYASPNDWDELVVAEAARLDVARLVVRSRSSWLSVGGLDDPVRLAAALWPLRELAADYRAFEKRTRTRLAALRKGTGDRELLAELFRSTVDFATTLEPDPLLPPELLPQPWPGAQARELMREAVERFRAELDEGARPAIFRAFDQVDAPSGRAQLIGR